MHAPASGYTQRHKGELTCGNAEEVEEWEFSQLLLLPCFDWQRDVLRWDE